MKLTKNCKIAIQQLNNSGYKAYAVGGAVRDFLLGRQITDIDITTSAIPEQILEVFKDYKTYPTGIKHGTITVKVGEEFFEITTFRKDSEYTLNRWPKQVDFINDVREDLKRRDFTINAIAYNDNEGYVDIFNGKTDCKNKIIRAVGDAEVRFQEDALRILRALRFASVLNFKIEYKTSLAIINQRHLLKNVSKERIYSELVKILLGDNVEEVLLKYKKVFFSIINKLELCDGFDHKSKFHSYDVYTHIVKSVAYSVKDKVIRLALLLHDVEKPSCFTLDSKGIGHFYTHQEKSSKTAVQILKDLKADNKTIKEIEFLIKYHDTQIDADKVTVKKWLNFAGEKYLKDLMMVKIADAKAHAKGYVVKRQETAENVIKLIDEIIKNNECYTLKQLKIDGKDLKEKGYQGERIASKLQDLLNKVIEGSVENKKEELLKIV